MTAKRAASALLMVIVALSIAPLNAQFVPSSELRVMRADYFQNYAGWFVAVEVFDDQVSADGSSGPAVSFAWRTATGSYGAAVDVPRFIDSEAPPNVYLYNRTLVRVGAAPPAASPDPPVMIRVTSGSGAEVEAPVRPWLAGAPSPPVAGYQRGFVTHYLNPTEVTSRFVSLVAEFPSLASIINLPNSTSGYRRKAQAVMGLPLGAQYTGEVGNLSPAEAQQAVILESVADGHLGGNNLFATFRHLVVANSPLSVAMSGNDVIVQLATDATGAATSTAAQIVAAINAHPASAAVMKAYRYRGNAGAGIASATPRSALSDFLEAPASVPRGPFQPKLLRIGTHRDGSRVGVFIYCQQHARDWVTPITCAETAEQLLRNYGTDPQTTQLVDNLDIFIVPTVNPDGAHYSMYDNLNQRRNLVNQCAPGTFQDPLARDAIGVDLDRNNTVGSIFDGFAGASSSCTNDLYAGPSEVSESETRNQLWVVDTFTNIKFSLNLQSFGGYFTWSPGAYALPGRVTLPRPGLGVDAYHFAAAEHILSRVKQSRGTAVLPERVGAAADVRASEAGNSADDQWYRRGIFAYTMAIGADRFDSMTDGTGQSPVGFTPDFAAEGQQESMESADGVIGLLERSLAYASDVSPPSVEIVPNGAASSTAVTATFSAGSEPATIHYTLDGSMPTMASPTWEAERPRLPGSAFLFTTSTTVRWIAVDIKGNVSAARSAEFVIDATPPVTTALVSPSGVNGWNVNATITLAADDGAGSGVDFIQYRLDGGPWTTYVNPFLVTGDGSRALEYQAIDLSQNVEVVQTLALRLDATPPVTTAALSPPGMNGWHVNPMVALTADDGAGIGVSAINYRVDGGPMTVYAGAFQITGDGAHALEYRASDLLGTGEAMKSLTVRVDATQPGISVTTPAAGAVYLLGAIIPAAYGCTDGTSGVLLCAGSAAAGAPIDTATAGPHMFVVNAQDAAGNTRQVSVAYAVVAPWPFSGFSGSISGTGENVARAGSVVAFSFSLGANRGLQIFAPGYPASAPRACAGGSEGALVPTESPGNNALRFSGGTYSYNWKTDRSWDGTCRVLVLKFADQSEVRALFRFR